MGRERGGGRTYGPSWGSGRPLKEEQGKQVKGSWCGPSEGRGGSRVGAKHVAWRHSPAPHGHPCSLALRGCPLGKKDRVRGGGNAGPVGWREPLG